MTSFVKQGERPVTFLVNDSGELSSVIGPNRARLPREALLATKGNILDGDCRNTLVRKKGTRGATSYLLSEPRWATIESSLPE